MGQRGMESEAEGWWRVRQRGGGAQRGGWRVRHRGI